MLCLAVAAAAVALHLRSVQICPVAAAEFGAKEGCLSWNEVECLHSCRIWKIWTGLFVGSVQSHIPHLWVVHI